MKFTDFTIDDEGILRISGRLCIPDVDNLRKEILEEALIVYIQVLQRCTTALRICTSGME